jgi:hypothetical protein
MVGYSKENIQNIIKKEIPKSFVFDFLDKVLNEKNVNTFSLLLDKDIVTSKYAFDLLIALLYREVITINDIIKSEIEGQERLIDKSNFIDILEAAIVLEYGFYEIPDTATITDPTNNNPIKYIRDMIPRLYYGNSGLLSYKDETNISNELEKIYNTVSVN